MSGVCSRHRKKVEWCRLCAASVSDLLPDFEVKLKDAESAGLHNCECGFVYYLTVDECPRCSRKRSGDANENRHT
jgi:hypothetical protein